MQDQLKSEGDINISENRKKWQENHTRSDEAKFILREDAKYFLHQSMSTPCLDVLNKCEGPFLENVDGKRYLDFHGNNVHQIGFANPFVIEQIRQQLTILPFSTRRFTNKAAVDFARRLISLLPAGLDRLLLAPGGTSAIGIALKVARLVTGKHKVISNWDSFHGASLDSIGVGGEAVFRQNIGPLFPGVMRIPPPMGNRGVFDDEMKNADYLEYTIEKEGEISAFIAETIRNTDVRIPSKKYWRRVREICTAHDILLILDEIPIALGRTGKMFAFENFGIKPDILCLGKGLGGGIMPFAAMICKEEFNDAAGNISLGHYTHEKSPLGCVAAHATLDFIEKEGIMKKVEDDEKWMKQELIKLKNKHAIIDDIRGIGLLWGVELASPQTKAPAADQAERVMYRCLENGLSFKVSQGNVLQLSPALTITPTELKQALNILDEALSYVSDGEK